jgi:hypothetical protein
VFKENEENGTWTKQGYYSGIPPEMTEENYQNPRYLEEIWVEMRTQEHTDAKTGTSDRPAITAYAVSIYLSSPDVSIEM